MASYDNHLLSGEHLGHLISKIKDLVSTKANTEDLSSVAFSNSYDDLDNLPTIPSTLSQLSGDSTHRIVTDTEKTTWNNKYAKPTAGIPASDLAQSVQNTLADVANKADESELDNYQPLISDLATIRSGAGLGATAAQPSDVSTAVSQHNTSGSAHQDIRDAIPNVVDNTSSTSGTEALSAKQGKLLNDRINNLQSIGRFLSLWDCTTGLPLTNPSGYPYTYHTGDYFRITTVAEEGGTNYMPNGSSYQGVASTTVYTGEVGEADIWFYDGTTWNLQVNHATGGTVQDVWVNGESSLDGNIAKITVPTDLADLTDDTTHRTVSDTEKSAWNGKQAALGFTPENVANKVTTLSSASTNAEYPTAKCVYDIVGDIATALSLL